MVRAGIHVFFRYWVPVVAYCVFIFVLSSRPMPETIPSWPLKDKMLHLGAYALLGFLFLRGFKHSRWRGHRGLIMGASIILTGLYGLSDEWHQYHVPFRSAEVGDVVADFAGGLCGVFFYDWLEKQWPILRFL